MSAAAAEEEAATIRVDADVLIRAVVATVNPSIIASPFLMEFGNPNTGEGTLLTDTQFFRPTPGEGNFQVDVVLHVPIDTQGEPVGHFPFRIQQKEALQQVYLSELEHYTDDWIDIGFEDVTPEDGEEGYIEGLSTWNILFPGGGVVPAFLDDTAVIPTLTALPFYRQDAEVNWDKVGNIGFMSKKMPGFRVFTTLIKGQHDFQTYLDFRMWMEGGEHWDEWGSDHPKDFLKCVKKYAKPGDMGEEAEIPALGAPSSPEKQPGLPGTEKTAAEMPAPAPGAASPKAAGLPIGSPGAPAPPAAPIPPPPPPPSSPASLPIAETPREGNIEEKLATGSTKDPEPPSTVVTDPPAPVPAAPPIGEGTDTEGNGDGGPKLAKKRRKPEEVLAGKVGDAVALLEQHLDRLDVQTYLLKAGREHLEAQGFVLERAAGAETKAEKLAVIGNLLTRAFTLVDGLEKDVLQSPDPVVDEEAIRVQVTQEMMARLMGTTPPDSE